MKIAFDAKRVFYNNRGLGNYARTLISSLVRAFPEHGYYLYTPQIKTLPSDFAPTFEKVQTLTQDDGFSMLSSSLWRSFAVPYLLKNKNISLFHGLSNELPFALGNVKKVVTIHDVIFLRFPKFFPWIDRQTYYCKTKYALAQADCVVAISEQTRLDILAFFKIPEDKIRVIYQSCLPLYYEEAKKTGAAEVSKTPYLLFVGAFEERKNLLTLVRSYARISRDIQEDLVLVGSGSADYVRRLRHEMMTHKVDLRVRLISNMSNADLPNLYRKATGFVFPTLFEGFGIPILEALACQTPVLTSATSSCREVGGNACVYVDPNQEEDIAEKMFQLVTNTKLRHELQNEALIQTKKFHWQQAAGKMMDVYLQI